MRFANHVSVIWDVTGFFDWIPVIPSVHHHLYMTFVPVAPVAPQPFGLSVDVPSIIAHPPGAACGDHKLTSTVYHNHVCFALDGHDLGHFLMHVCVPPLMPGPCTLMEFNILLSSRKAKFSAGEVKANGKPVACCTMIEPSDPTAITPMLTCGAMPVPNSGCGTSVAFNSLLVGMHWIDMLAGVVDTAVSVAQGILMSMGPVEAGNILDGIGFNPVPDFGSLAGNGIRLLGQQQFDYSGDASFEYKPLSGPLGELGTTATVDGVTGEVVHEVGGAARLGGIAEGHGTLRDRYQPDGTRTDEVSGGASWFGGGHSDATGRRNPMGNYDAQPSSNDGTSTPWDDGAQVPFL